MCRKNRKGKDEPNLTGPVHFSSTSTAGSFLVGFLLVLVCSCSSPAYDSEEIRLLHVPATFDSLPPAPADNPITAAGIALGERLFFDTRLSADGSVSCANCHKPSLAFADTVPISPGVHGRLDFRNSPSLLNVGYQRALFREGGIPSLELQVLAPFVNESEMDINLREVHDRLAADEVYQTLAREMGEPEFSPLVMARALATFQRSLLSTGSRYDAWLLGDSASLSPVEIRGMGLFFSPELACAGCHVGFLFTDQEYYNIGLYTKYKDEGRGRLTMQPGDMGKMKTPSLRNVALTPPYMHDGSMATLTDVIEFFNNGAAGHANQDPRIRPLGLSTAEVGSLVAFLSSLTDTALVFKP